MIKQRRPVLLFKIFSAHFHFVVVSAGRQPATCGRITNKKIKIIFFFKARSEDRQLSIGTASSVSQTYPLQQKKNYDNNDNFDKDFHLCANEKKKVHYMKIDNSKKNHRFL